MIKTFKIVFFRTKWPRSLKLSIQHQTLEYYQVCSNDDTRLTFDLFMQRLTLVSYLFSCGLRLRSCETLPTVAAVRGFCRFRGVPKVQPAEDTQTMTHARSTISLVVRVTSQSKNNFYDVNRLKIIESRYFPKEKVKVGLEKIKQNGGQLKATKCR